MRRAHLVALVLAVLVGGCASAVRAFDELIGVTRNGVPVAPGDEADTVSPWWWLLTLAAPALEKGRRAVVRARRARRLEEAEDCCSTSAEP